MITRGNFDCGHIEAEKTGGMTNVQNLRPICRLCNSSMSTKNMLTFMTFSGFQIPAYFNGTTASPIPVVSSSQTYHQKSDSHSLHRLNLKELKSICEYLNVPKTGTKEKLIKNIGGEFDYNKYVKERLAKLTVAELKELCSKQDIPCSGTKAKLCEKLVNSEKFIEFSILVNGVKDISEKLETMDTWDLQSLCERYDIDYVCQPAETLRTRLLKSKKFINEADDVISEIPDFIPKDSNYKLAMSMLERNSEEVEEAPEDEQKPSLEMKERLVFVKSVGKAHGGFWVKKMVADTPN